MRAPQILAPIALLAAAWLPLTAGEERAPRKAVEWPMYRYDAAQTGVSPGRGRITRPRILWEQYLGAPETTLVGRGEADPWRIDLDGDGTPERVVAGYGEPVRVLDAEGKTLWTAPADAASSPELTRAGAFIPGRKGRQLLLFTSRMDTGAGQGICFAFDRGVAQGEVAWCTGPLTGYYSPTLIVDDVDGDGAIEVVTAPHYRVEIRDAATGRLEAEVPVSKGRNYGILLSRPRRDQPQKDLFVISDFVLHVECVRWQKGRWSHAWGHKYLEDENAPAPRGRQKYLRIGPNPVVDLDGDGRDEVVYNFVDDSEEPRWRLRVRDGESGALRADLPGIWLWAIAELDGEAKGGRRARRPELLYTPTDRKRPPAECELRAANFVDGRLIERARLPRVRPLLTRATLPRSAHTIADEGLQDLLRADLDGDRRPELFVALAGRSGRFAERFRAVSLDGGRFRTRWQLARPGRRLDLVALSTDPSGTFTAQVRDLSAETELRVNGRGRVTAERPLGRPGGFTTMPIVADLDGDGAGEVLVQNAAREILALRSGEGRSRSLTRLWSHPGVGMNRDPGYTWNGALPPLAADLDGDGRPEVLFAAEAEGPPGDRGLASLVCVDGRGRQRWRRSFPDCPWGGLQAGVNLWTVGRFTGRARGLDVYVDLHRRAKGSSEGWVLRGDTGAVVWHREGVTAEGDARTFGYRLPAVAEVTGDGIDDLILAPTILYGVFSGATGDLHFPPRVLYRKESFGRWLLYNSPTVADLDGDGRLDAYLNSDSWARGGYASARIDGTPLWVEPHPVERGSDGFGPVGDFDGDGRIEIAVPVLDGSLLCLSGADGARRWKIQAPVTGDVIAADVNGDGVYELLFGGKDGILRAVSGRDGHELWSLAMPGRPIVADVDGDGAIEVLAVGSDGTLRIAG